ncbi:hypothetical protein LXL04_003942 [Taraxacum kok-saghyz]
MVPSSRFLLHIYPPLIATFHLQVFGQIGNKIPSVHAFGTAIAIDSYKIGSVHAPMATLYRLRAADSPISNIDLKAVYQMYQIIKEDIQGKCLKYGNYKHYLRCESYLPETTPAPAPPVLKLLNNHHHAASSASSISPSLIGFLSVVIASSFCHHNSVSSVVAASSSLCQVVAIVAPQDLAIAAAAVIAAAARSLIDFPRGSNCGGMLGNESADAKITELIDLLDPLVDALMLNTR